MAAKETIYQATGWFEVAVKYPEHEEAGMFEVTVYEWFWGPDGPHDPKARTEVMTRFEPSLARADAAAHALVDYIRVLAEAPSPVFAKVKEASLYGR